MLCAHMDEVGLMVRRITDEGYLKFDAVGALDRRVLLGKPVRVGPKGIPGVVGLKAYHLVSREEEKSVPKLDEFYIDIGAKDKAGAEALVSLGDVAAFDSTAGDFGSGLLQGKALGEPGGVRRPADPSERGTAPGLHLCLYRPGGGGQPGRLRRGLLRHPGARPGAGGADTADAPGVPAHKRGCTLGKGVVLPVMDKGSIADRGLFDGCGLWRSERLILWQTSGSIPGPDGRRRPPAHQGRRADGHAVGAGALPPHPLGAGLSGDVDGMLALTRAFLSDLAEKE